MTSSGKACWCLTRNCQPRRAALVELVPSSDPMAVEWSRRFDTSRLNQTAFEAAAVAMHFAEVERLPIPGSQRVLYLLRTA